MNTRLLLATATAAVGIASGLWQSGEHVASTLAGLRVGEPSRHENLTLFPLLGPATVRTRFRLLDEAVRSEDVLVQEKDGGRVNTVRMRNEGKDFVFGMAGEIISGAKQDRMLQDDVILPPGSEWLDVPVYCTEHGRWQGSSLGFGSKSDVVAGRVRERAAKSGSQHEVWAEVAAARADLRVETPTEAFAKVYEDRSVQEQARPYIEKLERLPGLRGAAKGVAVVAGGRLVCVDVFGSAELFRRMWPKLLRSYVIDAVSRDGQGCLGRKEIELFLQSASGGEVRSRPSVGAGSLFRIIAPDAAGSALLFRNGAVHIDLFPDRGPMYERDRSEGAPRLDIRRQNRTR